MRSAQHLMVRDPDRQLGDRLRPLGAPYWLSLQCQMRSFVEGKWHSSEARRAAFSNGPPLVSFPDGNAYAARFRRRQARIRPIEPKPKSMARLEGSGTTRRSPERVSLK